MAQVLRLVGGMGLLVVAGFCLFGFMAAFEPGSDPWHVFKLGYAAIALGCVGLTFRLGLGLWNKRPAVRRA